ncbi:general transcription factor 3C polypeptide 2 [Kryptolebias marmoratus]|uniref:General transcription factor IIIC, polypeptide 2, beta n=1 Tax=Kryptolebias marmoratus TaxID=37003 RepID=A0A3Q3AZB9_KRYMA|nr:general transcription factor 3C polypeptide 2 [Kryptolebias marmoratus]
MDSTGSGGGQEEPSEQPLYLSVSSKGRQRRKSMKYVDYVTDYTAASENVSQELLTKRSEGDEAVPEKGSRRGRKPKAAVLQTSAGDQEAKDEIAPGPVGETAAATPKKRGRQKKNPPVTPRKLTVTTDGDLPAGEDGGGVAENSVTQNNDTPKPKRKYVRKKFAQPAEDLPSEKVPEEPEEEAESGGRRRRGAAKVALKYLHLLAKEAFSHPSDDPDSKLHADNDDGVSEQKGPKGRKGRKRKHLDSETAEDEDFVPNVEEEADELEDESEGDKESDADSDFVAEVRSPAALHVNRHYTSSNAKPINGIDFNIIQTIWDSVETTKKFREEHYSSWVFPEWVPSTKEWDPVPESDLEKYLPQELQSAAFRVSREGLSKEETPQLSLSRFESAPAHSDRWDMSLFAGGPLWAVEWCPTPDGAPATQYVALACHRGMDDSHCVNRTYAEPGLVQLWDCGTLEYNERPDSQPALVYGLAQDKGFIWQLKWCPAGGWEPPGCGRKAPFLPRLGLLAVAASSGVVTVYSLPHPAALLTNTQLLSSEKENGKPPIYKARGVITLKLGSIKAPREEKSGQVLTMDWLPQKPHNIIAIGFFDGVVGLWDLSSKSALLRVRESDRSLTLLPYRCIPAHNHTVRALAFCPASRHLLTTAGEDRFVKMWDLRRLFDPIKVQKRYLTNEICWPLHASGLMMAEDGAFVPRGSTGIHFFDHNMNSYFALPRSTSVWSMSYSEWLNGVMAADLLGEVTLSMLPSLSYFIPHIKRPVRRRFPVYFTAKVPHEAKEEEREEEGGNQKDNEGGRGGKDASPHLQFQTYKEAVQKYFLHYSDFDMRSLVGMERRALWKRMQSTEVTAIANVDDMPLTALHKVRFNPNMSSHVWLVSGGQTGLLRLHCLRTMITSRVKKMIGDNQAQFNALYSPEEVQTADELL